MANTDRDDAHSSSNSMRQQLNEPSPDTFTRPHPLFWRLIFILSILYELALIFILFQDYDYIKEKIYSMYPDLKEFHIDTEKEYGVNCSDITVERIWDSLDVFAWGHFVGWATKAVLVRHYGICWTISVTWEITEMAFAHLLPNFIECWWDAYVLDVLVCNGLGIYCGMWICRKLEMREYNWERFKDIPTPAGKLQRAVLQFTPVNWSRTRWLEPKCSYVRMIAVTLLVIFWQITELNTFFLKHIFEIPPAHSLSVMRLALISFIVAPSIRQYYTRVTDTRVKKLGSQCKVFGAIMFTELFLCIKFGRDLFAQTQIPQILMWLGIQFLMSIFCVILCVIYSNTCESKKIKVQ